MNTPEARTETGEIKNQSESKPVEAAPPETTPEPKPVDSVPEKYEFTAPEGQEINPALIEAASPVFKELGLTNDQAQKLVDTYNKLTGDASAKQIEAVNAMRESWRNEVSADKEIGGKLDAVKAEIGKSLNLLPADLRDSFKSAMDLTGAGDHPAFVKAFYKLSQMVNEGKPVSGSGPSKHGQAAPGGGKPSIASAMYPNLPSN